LETIQKYGISKAGINLLTSSINTVNYTNLPFEFENEYLYAYIFTLYEKFYFSKLLFDFKKNTKYSKAAKDFIEFTNDVWVHELTNNDNGTLIYNDTKDYIIKYNGSDTQYAAYKNNNGYFKYEFIKKTYHNHNYIEIIETEINETAYNKLFL